MKEKIKVAVYNNAKDFDSVMKAEEKCREYIAQNKNMTLVKCYSDIYQSNIEIKKRDGLKQMLTEGKKIEVDLVIVASTRNITRNTTDLMWAIKEFEKFPIGSFFVDGEKYGKDFF